uniref:Uncharacterized protein n=1 Tax=Ditylenchus dipsaci TaxID=166011 RepID=A0A915DS03_9BILA
MRPGDQVCYNCGTLDMESRNAIIHAGSVEDYCDATKLFRLNALTAVPGSYTRLRVEYGGYIINLVEFMNNAVAFSQKCDDHQKFKKELIKQEEAPTYDVSGTVEPNDMILNMKPMENIQFATDNTGCNSIRGHTKCDSTFDGEVLVTVARWKKSSETVNRDLNIVHDTDLQDEFSITRDIWMRPRINMEFYDRMQRTTENRSSKPRFFRSE